MIKKIKARSLIIGGVFTLLFVVLIGKVYWLQVVEASWLLENAQQAWETDKVLSPVRGSILDRNDKVLAVDSTAYTVSLNPQLIAENNIVEDVAQGLADILKESDSDRTALVNKIRERAQRTGSNGKLAIYSEIRNEGWKIDKDRADKVQELIKDLQAKLKTRNNIGVYIAEDKKRYYPGETLASHILGYTNKEGIASLGLELKLDDLLKGTPGMLNYETDAKGVELPESTSQFKPAINGKNVRLTIDKNIQYYMESALASVNEKWHPKSIMGIAVDPKTMEVLAMANLPTFNPNQYWTINDQRDFINRSVASQYEPGSTFKLVTLAATVQEGIFNPNDKYQSGSIKVTDRVLHDHNYVGWGVISYLDGLKRSSNVAFVKLGYEKLGEEKLKSYIDKFGFGQKTDIDLPGEISGVIDMKYPAEFATATYGQGKVVTTAIQQTAAYGAIANGGKLMWPHVVKDVLDPETGEVIQSFAPKEVRQVVSEQTAKQVSEYLEQVVSDQKIGTGAKAYIDGYRVAGKTGTANIVLPGDKTYSPDTWVISFIGYAPVEDPRILVTLIADQPDLGGNYHLGGEAVAPAFKEIVTDSLRYMGVPSSKAQPELPEVEANTLKVPDFSNMTVEDAKNKAKENSLQLEVLGTGSNVVEQFPKPGTEILSTQRIYVAMQALDAIPLPSLSGKSLRDAMEVCSFLKVRCEASGEGYVTQQSVTGEGEGRTATLQLMPLSETFDNPPVSSKSSTSKDAKDMAKTDKATGDNQQQSGSSKKSP